MSYGRLDPDRLASRVIDFTRDDYLSLAAVVQSGVLALAALILVRLLENPVDPSRFLTWAASLSLVFVTHTTWRRGALFASGRHHVLDSILPILLGLTEFLCFAILERSKQGFPEWDDWSLAISAWGLVAALLIANRVRQSKDEDFEEALRPLLSEYRGWLGSDLRGAIFVAFSSAVFWGVIQIWEPRGGWVHFTFAFAVLATSTIVLWQIDKQQSRLASHINSLTHPE